MNDKDVKVALVVLEDRAVCKNCYHVVRKGNYCTACGHKGDYLSTDESIKAIRNGKTYGKVKGYFIRRLEDCMND